MSAGFVAQLAREERFARRERAKRLAAQHFPTEGPYLDGFAVMAILNLWSSRGEGKTTLGQVRRERARLLRRLETHSPNTRPVARDRTDCEAEAA